MQLNFIVTILLVLSTLMLIEAQPPTVDGVESLQRTAQNVERQGTDSGTGLGLGTASGDAAGIFPVNQNANTL
ncbi:hypothetical protein BDA99DRAFT_510482 [Phascolomyces articulosus]|uniref:Uncharacterized protein n=1 Tax=Phascolomyces articulosus TaxID=60185 RepID=A0AAD5K935_9FUNG|nr:hypothetical protein BDA99DRAFT_510482 [Phascolomyces articulosus]